MDGCWQCEGGQELRIDVSTGVFISHTLRLSVGVVETMLSGKKCLEATVVHLIKMPEMMYNPKLRFITKLR